ncbi:MAG TPA: SDR family oxidoreductase, partial [Thermoanaerobaculia bacterium]|nr:SDR family oxidoreductase [Thermoanaerobaculia bacterium]
AAATLYRHTARAIERAELAGGWRPLGARALYEVEAWDLEQAKLAPATGRPPLAGRVALVTGSASGIGRAAARALATRGAAVVGLDLVPGERGPGRIDLEGDAADPVTLAAAVALAAERFGGLDIVVSNLGVFPASAPVESIPAETWQRTMRLNVDAHRALLAESIPLLRLAPAGGAVVVVGSKNVPAPGPGAAAYSASKAALTQLARVAALELARDGVRVNVVHPDAVFDTGLWSADVLAARAARYGLSVEEYRRRNLLRREVRSEDVGELVAELAGDLFRATTGAQIPVDGGNERVV